MAIKIIRKKINNIRHSLLLEAQNSKTPTPNTKETANAAKELVDRMTSKISSIDKGKKLLNETDEVEKVVINCVDKKGNVVGAPIVVDLGLLRILHRVTYDYILKKDPELGPLANSGLINTNLLFDWTHVDTAATDPNGNIFVNPLFMFKLLDYGEVWFNDRFDFDYDIKYDDDNRANFILKKFEAKKSTEGDKQSNEDEDMSKAALKKVITDNFKNSFKTAYAPYCFGYAFVLIHEAFHHLHNHFERERIKQNPPVKKTKEDHGRANLLEDMEINREIESVFPYLKGIVNACHGYIDTYDETPSTWEYLWNEGVGIQENQQEQGDDEAPTEDGTGPVGTGQGGQSGGQGGEGGSNQPLVPLNDDAQRGFEDGWNQSLEDVLSIIGAFPTSPYDNGIDIDVYTKELVPFMSSRINLLESGNIPLPSSTISGTLKRFENADNDVVVEKLSFVERFKKIGGSKTKSKLNETVVTNNQQQKIPQTYADGYYAGYTECWNRIAEEWNPSAVYTSGDKQIRI